MYWRLGWRSEVPRYYLIEVVARRWGIPPWEAEQAPIEWFERALIGMKAEAKAQEYQERQAAARQRGGW